ncbi:MAG TPA: FeoA domain-containing protein [Candidatus Azoamicus sp. OHIO1]
MFELKNRDAVVIIKYSSNIHTSYRQNLLALGLVPGVVILIGRIAPLGDPIELCFNGNVLSLRKLELEIIDMKKLF